jgi:hypothetical protein
MPGCDWLNAVTARPRPGTQAQKVIFTALLLEQFAPASTVTDELGLGAADAALAVLVPLAAEAAGVAGVVGLVLPLLHAARPVTAARAAMPPRVRCVRLLLVLVLSLFIGGTPLFLFVFAGARPGGGARLTLRARR